MSQKTINVGFVNPQVYTELQTVGLLPVVEVSKAELLEKYKPDADTSIERRRNQRKLKIAQRYLRRAKTPGAKAAAAMSVRMLEEMLKA